MLLDARDGVKLTDFGFRHALLDSPEPPGQLEGGLPAFISPEVLAGVLGGGLGPFWVLERKPCTAPTAEKHYFSCPRVPSGIVLFRFVFFFLSHSNRSGVHL